MKKSFDIAEEIKYISDPLTENNQYRGLGIVLPFPSTDPMLPSPSKLVPKIENSLETSIVE